MKYLIYLSSAVELFSAQQLDELLIKSRKNNAEKQITGMLLYNDGSFIQVLEGEANTLNGVYNTIKADPRHKNIITIAQGEHPERAFAQWPMGFRRATSQEVATFEAYADPKSIATLAADSEHPAFTILKTFVRTNLM